MAFRISDADLARYLDDDAAPFDLTTELLGIGSVPSRITFRTREDAVVCCTDEASRLLTMCGADVENLIPSGTRVAPGDTLLVATGPADVLHQAWKVCLNLLDSLSGVATAMARLNEAAKEANPNVAVLPTRKYFPGAKALVTKAIVVGGSIPHRSGLAETVLVFENHLRLIGGIERLIERLPEMKSRAPEKRILVECSLEDAMRLAEAGVDGLQLDKVDPTELAATVPHLRAAAPGIVLLATGGINLGNVAEFAATGVDGLVTSSPYSAKPIDMGARIELISEPRQLMA